MTKSGRMRVIHLKRVDPILGAAIKKLVLAKNGLDEMPKKRRNYFKSLVVAIVNQQLSGKAAATILKRFEALFPGKRFPKPEDVLKMPVPKMRKAGLSRMKISFLKDLSQHIIKGSLDFKKLSKLADEEVIEQLVRVKGIGRWTAEMFLIFSLGRNDVFSYGDLGLRNAIRALYKLKAHPTPAQAEKISAAWKPYRSLASRYLWASLDNR
jgi:DNA-3-methyladenine glycosylase II